MIRVANGVAMELLAAHQRDLNCLSDESRQTRRRALERLAPLASPHPHPSLLSFWTQALCAPTLKLFSDPVEKCRELAICLATEVVRTVPAAAAHTLPPLMPVLLSRLVPSSAAPDEASEEIRLLLLQLTELAVQACGEASGEQAAPLVQVLCACLSDAFPEAKKAGCALILKVTAVMPEPIVPHCATLAAALQPCLTHQHSRVRALATEALVALLILEPSPLVEMVPQLALITTDRAPSVREQAVHSIAELLARMPQRRVHAARLLPLLLCALSDEVESWAPSFEHFWLLIPLYPAHMCTHSMLARRLSRFLALTSAHSHSLMRSHTLSKLPPKIPPYYRALSHNRSRHVARKHACRHLAQLMIHSLSSTRGLVSMLHSSTCFHV
ncbi:MAG: hypothetical protein SGPRY_005093 [Prymnesium sp.]